MATPEFKESECEIGGCLCSIWNDWLWSRVEFVQAHPRAVEFAELRNEDAIMDAEDELLAELELSGDLPVFKAPPCERPTCARYAGKPRADS